MTPSVSVVLPAYNAARFLKDALESVFRQSHPADEVLVVDDGSTDETGRLAQAFRGVHCIHQANSGVAAARNRGLQEARGQFIAFLDADDVWCVDKLAVQAPDLRRDRLSYSARTETDERLQATRVVQSERRFPLLEGLLFHGNVVGTPSSVIAPRDVLLEAGGFDVRLSMCADWDLWIRLATQLSSGYSERPLVLYRIHGDSMSTNLKRYESDSEYMLGKAFGLALPAHLAARQSEAESRMWEVLGGCYWNQGAIGDALRCALRSVQRRPTRLAALTVSAPFRIARRAFRKSR